MPISHLDKFFGGKPGAAADALRAMKQTYGPKDGEHVFYAKVAKAKHRGKVTRNRGR